MSTSPKKRRFDDADDGVPNQHHSQGLGCIAHGCPLPGTLSDSVKGGGGFQCFAHDRLLESGKYGLLTQGIKENLWLFKVAERVACMPIIEIDNKQSEIAAYLAGRGRPELARMANTGEWSERCRYEPRPNWAIRLRNAAYNAAMAYVEANWQCAA